MKNGPNLGEIGIKSQIKSQIRIKSDQKNGRKYSFPYLLLLYVLKGKITVKNLN